MKTHVDIILDTVHGLWPKNRKSSDEWICLRLQRERGQVVIWHALCPDNQKEHIWRIFYPKFEDTLPFKDADRLLYKTLHFNSHHKVAFVKKVCPSRHSQNKATCTSRTMKHAISVTSIVPAMRRCGGSPRWEGPIHIPAKWWVGITSRQPLAL
jgi:hypothetical protein